MNNLIGLFKEIIYLGATASVLILIILLIKKIFNKALSPKWHYYIWVLLLIRLLIPFYPESSVSIYNLFNAAGEKVNLPISQISIPFQESSLNGSSINTPKTADASVNKNNITNSDASSPITNTTLKANDILKFNSAITLMTLVCAIGVLLFSLYTLYINIAFAVNVHKKYTPLKDERINGILDCCKDIMKIKHTIPLLSSKKVRTPSLYGFFNTKILVSKPYLDQLSDAEIKYIFLHELTHYKRKDIVTNWIIALLQIIYFFNPLIWYAFNKIREDCEISCDAEALRYINEVEYQGYGRTIIKLIKLLSESNFIPVTMGISKNKSSYKRRIIMISKFKKSKWTNTLLSIILIISVGLIGLTGCKVSTNNTTNTESKSNAVSTISPNSTTSIQQENNTQGDSNTPKPSQNTNTNTNTNTNASANETKEAFYGEWVINQVLAFGPVGAYSSENAKSLIGKTLSFSQDKASFFGDQPSDITKLAANPVYKKSVISNADFITNYRIPLDKLGLKTDSIAEVSVSDPNGYVSTFFIKDNNTLIIYGGGTYFELIRKTV
ncbi:M56 family metallopeptidase [Candidatus Clostridium stratigraminis]|uniref:M56 family metallopeptidase n=1 Tax=Candidatus Clostridium stratigraminis TaxID=3381661 RepID=A0ABW8SZ63_9CLOT